MMDFRESFLVSIVFPDLSLSLQLTSGSVDNGGASVAASDVTDEEVGLHTWN